MKNSWMRTGAVVATVSALGLAVPTPAWADSGLTYGGFGGEDGGLALQLADGSSRNAGVAGVYGEEDEVGDARAYRLDLAEFGTGEDDSFYRAKDWDAAPVDNLDKAHGVVAAGYPSVAADKLLDEAGASTVADPEGVAYAATQAAVWSVTVGAELNSDDPTDQDPDVDQALVKVVEYLLDTAEPTGEPANKLTIAGDPTRDGDLVGPFHFTGVDDAGFARIEKSKNGTVTDAKGKENNEITDGEKFYVKPAAGVKKLTIAGTAEVGPLTGTLMLCQDTEKVTLILAEAATWGVETQREITVEAAAGGDGQLPVTGTSLTGFLAVGAGLLLGGGLLLFAMRRKTSTTTA